MPNSKLENSAQSNLYSHRTKAVPSGSDRTATVSLVGTRPLEDTPAEGFPCIYYECNASLEITFISANAIELINLTCSRVIGTKAFSHDKVFPEDTDSVAEGLRILQAKGSTTVLHRILDDAGLPKWVANRLQRIEPASTCESYRGCILPIQPDQFTRGIERSAISRFVHKIGNHFQLLTLLVNPLRKFLPESKEVEILEQTVEKAVELTRAFSDYTQGTACFVEFNLSEILNGIVDTRKPLFAEKGIKFDVRINESASRVTVKGDPFLLDTAISSILQNALEATESAGSVVFSAKLENCAGGGFPALSLIIEDTGCGIQEENLSKIAEPFFTSKRNRDGLGLSMASRFIELHGGILSVDSQEGKGTKVEISLPVESSLQPLER